MFPKMYPEMKIPEKHMTGISIWDTRNVTIDFAMEGFKIPWYYKAGIHHPAQRGNAVTS